MTGISERAEETNYWPSISDMFLAFFIIALALYAQKDFINADDYIINDIVEESNLLFERAGLPRYEKEAEDKNPNRPILAKQLLQAGQWFERQRKQKYTMPPDVLDYIRRTEMTEQLSLTEEELRDRASSQYHLAVQCLAWQVLSDAALHTGALQSLMEKAAEELHQQDESKTPTDFSDFEKLCKVFEHLKDDAKLRHVNAVFRDNDIGGKTHSNKELEKWLEQARNETASLKSKLDGLKSKLDFLLDFIVNQSHYITDKTGIGKNKTVTAENACDLLDGQIEEALTELINLRKANPKKMAKKISELEQKLALKDGELQDARHLITQQQEEVAQLKHARDAREQHVMLDDTKVNFIPGQTGYTNPHIAHQNLDEAAVNLAEFMEKNKEKCHTYVIEIIGHTDIDGSSMGRSHDETKALEKDELNPRLGLLRAVAIRNELEQRPALQQLPQHSIEVTFRCYSGSWLTPLQLGKYGYGDSGQDNKDIKQANRRVEVFVRPVFKNSTL